MEKVELDCQELFDLRRGLKGLLGRIDRLILEKHLTIQQVGDTQAGQIQTTSRVK